MMKSWQIPLANPMAPFHRTWIINAPWAHPFWQQYALFLYDLTTDIGKKPVLYKADATHEFLLYALDLKHRLKPEDRPLQIHYLRPANHGYQFTAASNEDAERRMQDVVDLIDTRKVSPDTDFRSQWDALFLDAAPLHKN